MSTACSSHLCRGRKAGAAEWAEARVWGRMGAPKGVLEGGASACSLIHSHTQRVVCLEGTTLRTRTPRTPLDTWTGESRGKTSGSAPRPPSPHPLTTPGLHEKRERPSDTPEHLLLEIPLPHAGRALHGQARVLKGGRALWWQHQGRGQRRRPTRAPRGGVSARHHVRAGEWGSALLPGVGPCRAAARPSPFVRRRTCAPPCEYW